MSVIVMIYVGLVGWTIINSLFLVPFSGRNDRKSNSASTPGRERFVDRPLVSLLVPMRNEEANVDDLLESVRQLTYPNLEVLLLDDRSTDETNKLLQQSEFTILKGEELPRDWIGKSYACHQLAHRANGDYLLFIDADVRLQPDVVERALDVSQHYNAGLVTGFPSFPVSTWLSRLLVPMQHFIVLLHLPIWLANKNMFPAATAAHGAFMFFKRNAYEAIGGHASVKSSLVEDVHIARNMKHAGYKVMLANVSRHVACHMYNSNRDTWEGFSKNIFNGIGRSWILAIMLIGFYTLVFVGPLLLALIAPLYGWMDPLYGWIYVVPLLLTILLRAFVDWRMNTGGLSSFWFIPFSAAVMVILLIVAMWRSIRKQAITWKGREYY
ncbi:glycosyltransferase family 2 protein [Bacillus sp. HMF5848]|uniref:glycosyltransferase n=1 Tax=Bacillus sp. HMF5848 TaxID=2495421 RepID=UPI000F7662C1|nr:glycosyltransferase [Bacillus sp. HMF5848]RSK26392.1 glycosyltransferase family 2 protein [Bacillus sp. HMF5848]